MLTRWLRNRVRALRELDRESGVSLIEVSVAIAAGSVVMAAIALTLIMTLRQTDRVTSHVEANQRARLVMTGVINDLHSACFFPQVAPVLEGSSGTKLSFMHQAGSAVTPTPVRSEIELLEGKLVERDANPTSGAGKKWTFPTPTSAGQEVLMKSIGPVSKSTPIFTYYSYSGGKISPTPLVTPLTAASAGAAVQVNIAFSASPESGVIEDENAATSIRNSALLRLTPPAYNNTTDNPPCE